MSSRPLHQRLIATSIILVALLVGAAKLYAAITGTPESTAPRMEAFASGSMSVASSKDGAAIFVLSNMAPGMSDQGEVTIGNTGSIAGTLVLSSFDLSDSPGIYGGPLSERLDLLVSEVTDGASTPVYADSLGSMPELELGTLDAGESHTYRFTISMADGGAPPSPYAGDNVYQRATARLGYEWTLTQSETDPGPGPPAPDAPVPAPSVALDQPCSTLLSGNRRGNTLVGTAGDDVIRGRGGRDLIFGGDGNDCAFGGPGPDGLYGNTGDDRLKGGVGRDRISGGLDSDVIFARDRVSDRIDCGAGTDTAYVDRHDRTKNCEAVHRWPPAR